jgi:hypothetical protein
MTELTRRALLRTGALAAAAFPFLSFVDASGSTTTGTLYRRSRFTPYLNSTFTLTTGTATWKATLVGIEDLQPLRIANDPDRFRLLFRTSTAGPAQQTCSVRRSGFTATPLFLVPADSTSRTYAAVVNRAF